jgi:SOS response regulatory protein OraA/RecX
MNKITHEEIKNAIENMCIANSGTLAKALDYISQQQTFEEKVKRYLSNPPSIERLSLMYELKEMVGLK